MLRNLRCAAAEVQELSGQQVEYFARLPTRQCCSTEAVYEELLALDSEVALQLAAIGARQLHLVDFDAVELTNVTTQGYRSVDVGLPKVTATSLAIEQLEPAIEVRTTMDRYRPGLILGDAVFCCVGSIAARSTVWRSAGRSARFWCDGRMLGEVVRVLTAADGRHQGYYESSLFSPVEAQAGSCTTRSTIYTASIAAGLMVHQFTRWLRGLAMGADLSLNLLSCELTASG